MPKHCLVKGCKSDDENGFPFPIDRPDVIGKWVLALEKHQELPPDYHKKVVCSAHFVELDFLKSKKNMISKKAVPSVFPTLPDGYVSEEEPKKNIKEEPEDEDFVTGGKHLRRKRLTIPVTEPDSEGEIGDMGSDYEPSDSNEEEIQESHSEDESEKMEDDSHENPNMNYQNLTGDFEMQKVNDPAITFTDNDTEETVDSDFEPVTETSIDVLQEKLTKKTDILKKETNTLNSMEEMIKNQAATIRKLEEELADQIKAETEENKASDKTSLNSSKPEFCNKTTDYSNLDLQMFSISLYYFNPKVYSYLESIMPYLPPKGVVIDWVKSGHAFTIFPPGVLLKDNFVLE